MWDLDKLIYARPGETKVQLVIADPVNGTSVVYPLGVLRALYLAQDLIKEVAILMKMDDHK